MDFIQLLVLALATWYVAYTVTNSAGPFDIFLKLRTRYPLGGLTTCIVCLSVWAAAALYVVYFMTPFAPVVYILAIAGGDLMLHSYMGWKF